MTTRWRAGAWVAVIGLYLLARAPHLDLALERDEGAFAAVGEAILHGGVAYRDVFDHKPAGVHYAYAAALLVTPPTATGIHSFLLVWTFATLLAVAAATAGLTSECAALWAAALFAVLSASPAAQGFSATSEMLLLLPLTASVWLALCAASRADGTARLGLAALAGALGAAACWFKPPALLPALTGVFVLVARRHAGGGGALRDLAAFAAGGAIVGAAPMLALVTVGADPWYWIVEHNRLCASLAPGNWGENIAVRWAQSRADFAAPLALAAVGLTWAAWRRQCGAGLAMVWLVLSLAAVPHSPFLYRHDLALALPALAAAGGIAIASLSARRRATRFSAQLALLALALAPGIAANPWYWFSTDRVGIEAHVFGRQGFAAAELVADYLRANTTRTAPRGGGKGMFRQQLQQMRAIGGQSKLILT